MAAVKNDCLFIDILLHRVDLNEIFEFCLSLNCVRNNNFKAEFAFSNIEIEVNHFDKFKEVLFKHDNFRSLEMFELNEMDGELTKPKLYVRPIQNIYLINIYDFCFNESEIFVFKDLYFADINYFPLWNLENSYKNNWIDYLNPIPSFLPKPSDEIYADNKKRYEFYEKFVLHNHTIFDESILWVHVAPIMLVSNLYFKYFPKFLWLSLSDCESIETISHNLIKIIIFSDVKASIQETNYNKLWSVRKQLGMDTITHEICEPVKHLNWIDPNLPVYITLKTEKGGFTKVTRYFDKNGKLCPKSQAKSLEIKEFLEDGVTCIHEETKQKGLFGWK